jgi:hypothetical protein
LVFAIQLQADRSGPLAPLTRFLHRQSGMILDTGIIIGLIAAMGTTQLLLAMGIQLPVALTLSMTLAEFVIALALTLWHLVAMVLSATTPVSDQIVVAVRFELDDLLDVRKAETLMQNRFKEIAAGYTWTVERFGGGSGLRTAERREFALKRKGIIADVDLAALSELHEVVKAVAADWEATLTLGPGNTADTWPALILHKRDRAIEEDPPAQVDDARPGASVPQYRIGQKAQTSMEDVEINGSKNRLLIPSRE